MRKNANGSGTIKKRSDGRWEAVFTYTDEIGRKKRKSIYGKTQTEARKKLSAAVKAVDDHTYREQRRMTVAQWLDEWLDTYCIDLKPMTITGYKSKIETRIKPYIGTVQISALNNLQIQKYYNLLKAGDDTHKPLAPKSIQNIHGILHKALETAVTAGILVSNPSDHCKLPTVKRKKMNPLMDDAVPRFLEAIKGDRYENLFIVDLFSGLRQSEILGLQWGDIDFQNGHITVQRQLQRDYSTNEYIFIDETKSHKNRIAAIPPSVVAVLRKQKTQQAEWKLRAGECWSNPHDLVFTDELGGNLKHHSVYGRFKRIVSSIGMEETRFHDLRHSYAVNALQNGDSPKEVCEQLGHYSAAFTLDTYADVSNTMRKASQDRAEEFFKSVASSY